MLKPYWVICTICIVSIISFFLLNKLGLNPHTNLVNQRMDLFEDNVNTLGHTYYFPAFLSILLVPKDFILKLPFFTENGIICGIYFEPHIVTFMLCPALFMLWAYIKDTTKRVCLFIIWLLIVLICTSTTNILCLLACLFIMLFYTSKGRFILLPISFSLVFLVAIIGLENTEFFFIFDKLSNTDGSMDYSQNTLLYAFQPTSIFGYNFMNNGYLHEITNQPKDVGYIPCILNLMFLIIAYFKMLKCFYVKKMYLVLMSCAILYFFLHSMKIAMVSYSLSFFIFIIFLLQILSKEKKKICQEV